MKNEVIVTLIAADLLIIVLVGFICYMVGYLRGMNFNRKK